MTRLELGPLPLQRFVEQSKGFVVASASPKHLRELLSCEARCFVGRRSSSSLFDSLLERFYGIAGLAGV
jgi:hypothetical protein